MAIDKLSVLAIIDAAKSQIDALPDVGGVNEQVALLQAQVAALEGQVSQMQADLLAKDGQIADLTLAVSSLSDKISNALSILQG